MIQYKDVQLQNMINLNNSIGEMLQNMELDCYSNASTTSAGIIGFVSDM